MDPASTCGISPTITLSKSNMYVTCFISIIYDSRDSKPVLIGTVDYDC